MVFSNASFGNKKLGNCYSKTSFVAEALCPADTVSRVLSEGLHHLWISWLRNFLLFVSLCKSKLFLWGLSLLSEELCVVAAQFAFCKQALWFPGTAL